MNNEVGLELPELSALLDKTDITLAHGEDIPTAEHQESVAKVGRFFSNGYSVVRQGEHSVSVTWAGVSMRFSENEADGRMGQLVDFLRLLIDTPAEMPAPVPNEGDIHVSPVVERRFAPVTLPEKKYPKDWSKGGLRHANMEHMDGYNEAIDDLAKLGPLYTEQV